MDLIMGTVTTAVELLSLDGGDSTQTLEVLVDTGAVLSMLPAAMLERLGVQRLGKVTAQVADGRFIERDVGNARLRVEGQEVWSRVIFGEPTDPSLLGLTVLEQLGLMVDPVGRRLVPTQIILY
jgi:predicted aspartyl protease